MDKYGGTKRTGVPVKTLKKLLKRAGLKVSGKKATLTRRAKKAKLFGGLSMGEMLKQKNLYNPVLTTKQIEAQAEAAKKKAEQAKRDADSERQIAEMAEFQRQNLEKAEKLNNEIRAAQEKQAIEDDLQTDYVAQSQSRGGKKKTHRS